MKRQRGRGRKPGNNTGNRSLESNGPDVKIRGTASQIYEKYMQYARDAQTAGDRVKAENYLQHAEHYYRIMAAALPKDRPPIVGDHLNRDDDDADVVDQADGAEDPLKVVDEIDASDVDSDEDGETESESEDSDAQQAANEGQSRRRRRSRRKPGEARGQDREARSALDMLAEQQAAIADS